MLDVSPANSPARTIASRGSLLYWLGTPLAMVLAALVLRLVVLTLGHFYRIDPEFDNLEFGHEAGRIGRALAEGHGFSSPFGGDTGPTAHLAPVYPFLVGTVFKMFGVYSAASAWVLLALNSVFSSLTCWTLYHISARTAGVRTGRWAGWVWAMLPSAIYWPIFWIWDTSLSAFLLSAALLLALVLEQEPVMRHWIVFGIAWGVLALTNPACLTLLPCCGIWVAWKLRQTNRPWFAGAVASTLVFFMAIAPWTIRNYRDFHKLVPIRDNFGIELRLANSAAADGQWMSWLHPSLNEKEYAKFVQMGETAYNASREQEALSFIREQPERFLVLCLRRAAFYWIGTPRAMSLPLLSIAWNVLFALSSIVSFWGAWWMVRDRRTGAGLFVSFFIVFPAIYYVTFPAPRYRHPIEPEMVLAACYLLVAAIPERRKDITPAVEPYSA